MIESLARFFIEKSKFTIAIMISILLAWIYSYLNIEKQYNPKIEVPAFQINISAPWMNSWDVHSLITVPLEDKIFEIPWVSDIYSSSEDSWMSALVKFEVWTSSLDAKVNLNQKLTDNMDLKPFWVQSPQIKSIDADDLPQLTIAIYMPNKDWVDLSDGRYLRQSAFEVKNYLRQIDGVSTFEIVWWEKSNYLIELQYEELMSRWLDVLSVKKAIEDSTISGYSVETTHKSELINLEIDPTSVEFWALERIVVWVDKLGSYVYLNEIADIRIWEKRLVKSSWISFDNQYHDVVFLWVGKKEWTNSVDVVDSVIEALELYEMPRDIAYEIIQNEWETAKNAISMLTNNLFQSIVIVFLVLWFSLGFRNALNSAIAIPLTLFIVFIVAFSFDQNINRITLFALILVLWMLVDDSTVVVENINRHLKTRFSDWKTKMEAIMTAISEVKMGVVLSTVTRLFAFGSMFFVTGMMWEYMEPIPWFGFIAFIASTLISLTINPFISYYSYKDIPSQREKHIEFKQDSWIKRFYLKIVWYFLHHDDKIARKRFRIFKYSFWLALILIIVIPISLWIFKARMLPKSDQNQVYLWIDIPENKNHHEIEDVRVLASDFIEKKSSLSYMVDSISYTSWQAFVSDFANLFRWGSSRMWENQLSMRINLKKDLENRLTSEEYVISLRKELVEILTFYNPGVKIRLLEDPPGPPVRATFMPIIAWEIESEAYKWFFLDFEKEVYKIKDSHDLVDIINSNEKQTQKIILEIDRESLSLKGLSYSEVYNLLNLTYSWIGISSIKWSSYEESASLIVTVDNDNFELLEKLYLVNDLWEKVYLSSVVDKKLSKTSNKILTDNKREVSYIYSEIWHNSVIYPVIRLYMNLSSDDFLGDKYELLGMDFYSMKFKHLESWEVIEIFWWWEWETTMDTFRDLWLAMIIAIISIIFVLVGQFWTFWTSLVVMITFLLWFFWIFPWYTLLYLINGEYFSATSMIWIIALAWIVVWNAILLIEYTNSRLDKSLENINIAILEACKVRFKPVLLTSLTTILWAFTILWDPVWSGLAWAIIWGLSVSSVLTLIVIPIFYRNFLVKNKKEI